MLERSCAGDFNSVDKRFHRLVSHLYLKSPVLIMTRPNLALLMRSDKITVHVISFIVFMAALGSEITRAGMKLCFPTQHNRAL